MPSMVRSDPVTWLELIGAALTGPSARTPPVWRGGHLAGGERSQTGCPDDTAGNGMNSAGRPTTVVLVDDEHLIRSALGGALRDGGVDLVGEAANAPDAIRVVLELRPDVVLMDLRLPGGSGVGAVRQLSHLAPNSAILILTRTEQNRVVEAIVAGASGYILKTATPAAIVAAIEATAAGEAVISSQIAGRLMDHIREREIPVTAASLDAAGAIRAVLTPRELEVFERLASGRTNDRIASELSLSTNTVANHIASILTKLHLDNRIQAAVQAVRSGIS
jgi:DNA-binding NarL/FixJ family response regulator